MVLPGFIYTVVRDCEEYLLCRAADFEAIGSPASNRLARDIRQSLVWGRPVHALVEARIRGDGRSAALTSEDGTAEVPSSLTQASFEVVPVDPGLTTREVAAQLRVGPRQVVNLIGSKQLAATRRGPGWPWVITQGAVDDYRLSKRSQE